MMSNHSGGIYIGVTSNLYQRVYQHKHDIIPGFTSKYRMHRLVFYESFGHIGDALGREKQLKGWRRSKKIELIERENPSWLDLSSSWYIDTI